MDAPARAPSRTLAADISDNNAMFDARAYASAGHVLVMIKATQGTGFTSSTWQPRVRDAHGQRLAVGHYHYCQPDDNPVLEARHFWGTVRPHFNPHVDRLLLDLEIGDQATWPRYLAELDSELHRLSGRTAIGYTFAAGLSPGLTLRSGLWWVAAWGTTRPATPRHSSLWGWQYASATTAPSGGPDRAAGIGPCDMTVIRNLTVRRILHDRERAWPGR